MFDSWELLHFRYDGLSICNQKHSVKHFFSDNDMIIKKKCKHQSETVYNWSMSRPVHQDLQDERIDRIKGKGKITNQRQKANTD